MATKKKQGGAMLAAEIAAGAAAAAAAGYYFHASKHAKQHRRAAGKWANAFKNEVVRDAKKLQKVDAKGVAKLVDTAARAYKDGVSSKDLAAAGRELKKNWKRIQQEAGGGGVKKVVKKAAKKVMKKAVKKAAKKATPRKKAAKRAS